MLGKLVSARINLLEAEASADAFVKIEGLNGLGLAKTNQLAPVRGELSMPCLVFDENHLLADGFFAFQLLERLRVLTGKFWFIFGPFESNGELRCHLVLPASQVPQQFVVYKWRVVEWGQEIQAI